MSEPLVCLVGSRTRGPALVDVLRDWSAVGLLRPFLWVEPARGALGRQLGVQRVESGEARHTTVQEGVADAGTPSVIRVCAVDDLSDRTGLDTAMNVLSLVHQAAPSTPTIPCRAAFPVLDQQGATWHQLPMDWHSIVVAPEDSDSPEAARVLLSAHDDPVRLAMHEAASLAGLLGLWAGVEESPLDTLRPPPDNQVRLARTFYWRREAGPVNTAVRNATLEVGDTFPNPLRDGQPLPHVANEAAAVAAAADGFLARQDNLKPSKRVQPERPPKQKIGLLEAIKRFLTFLGKALLAAPAEGATQALEGAKTRLARLGQAVIYGSSSSYQVVVKGRLPNGRLARLEDLEAASAELARGISQSGYREHYADLSSTWKDFMAIGLTLADGQQRVSSVPQPLVGTTPAVVAQPIAIAPGIDDAFEQLPPDVKARLGIEEILASDLQRTNDVLAQLQEQSRHSVLALEMSRTQGALESWRKDVQLRSYAGRVGNTIYGYIGTVRDQIAGYRAILERDATKNEASDAWAKREAARRRWSKGIMLAALVVLVGLGIAVAAEWITYQDLYVWGGVTFLTALITVIAIFIAGQIDLYRLLNMMEDAGAEKEAARQNMASALADLERISAAYRQYIYWASALGAFVRQPFGPPMPEPETFDIIAGELPRSMWTGIAVPQEGPVAQAAQELRREVFRAGWLGQPFDALIADAPNYGEASLQQLRGNQDRLFADRPTSPASPLVQFVEALRAGGVRSTGGDRQWKTTSEQLQEVQDAGIDLLTKIEWAGDRDSGPVAADRHVSQGLPFDPGVLRPHVGLSSGLQIVRGDSKAITRRDGLSRTIVLSQFGSSFDPHELSLQHAADTEPEPRPRADFEPRI